MGEESIWPETLEPPRGEPPSEEARRVCEYTTERPLMRPQHSIVCLAGVLLACATAAFVLGYVLSHLAKLGIESRTAYTIAAVASLAIGLRYILICTIRVYQQYAPERVRRRCMLMPTCSEYCVLALKKYGLLLGV